MAISPVFPNQFDFNPAAAIAPPRQQPVLPDNTKAQQLAVFTPVAQSLATEMGRTIAKAQANNTVIPPRDLDRLAKALNKTYHVVESIQKRQGHNDWWI